MPDIYPSTISQGAYSLSDPHVHEVRLKAIRRRYANWKELPLATLILALARVFYRRKDLFIKEIEQTVNLSRLAIALKPIMDEYLARIERTIIQTLEIYPAWAPVPTRRSFYHAFVSLSTNHRR